MAVKKTKRHNNDVTPISSTRKPVSINPKTENQEKYLSQINSNDITFGIGPAGTGKTYLATKAGMKFLTEGHVSSLVICRPAVESGERLGFLPGNINDKMDPYIRPIIDSLKTYWRISTIKDYIANGIIEISPLAYMRGRTFNNTFIIADEMQNATLERLRMLLTRLGNNSKMVVTGDPTQNDVSGYVSCLEHAKRDLKNINGIAFQNFEIKDVVRHPIVANILEKWPENCIQERI